jgi:hypothetical protein
VTREQGHGRKEVRTYLQLPAPEGLPGALRWKGLKSLGLVTSHCHREGEETVEVRYYLSSLGVDVTRFARAARGHWGVEINQPEDPRSDNLCGIGGAGYHRRRRPVGVGRVERHEHSGPRRHLMLDIGSICVPPRPRSLRRTH